jgi:hypothetical protein
MSRQRNRRPPQRPEDQASGWFLTLEIAESRWDLETVAEARRELDRLGWRVTRMRNRHTPTEGRQARGGGDMTTTAHDTAITKEEFIRHVRRIACNLARTNGYFDADALWEHITKPPPGIDARLIGNALLGLRADGLIERVKYKRLDRVRTHGRPQSLWKAKDPAAIDAWLRDNPPGKKKPPTTIQTNLPFSEDFHG